MADKTKLYEQVKVDLAAQIRELLDQRGKIEDRIDILRDALAAVLKVSGEEAMGYVLTDLPSGISEACKAIIKYADQPLKAVQIRDALEEMKFPGCEQYGNALATIHTVLKRMEKKGWLIPKDKDGKTAYVWNDAQYVR